MSMIYFNGRLTLTVSVLIIFAGIFSGCGSENQTQGKIDRYALVTRHNVEVTKFDSLNSLSVGNGDFAFTVDATGLQTFPNYYRQGGVPLGTESQWGWHSFANPHNYKLKDVMKKFNYHGRKVSYAYGANKTPQGKAATHWLRANPHRIDLGRIGFDIIKPNGSKETRSDFSHIHQKLDLWTGIIYSHFEVDGVPVNVQTLSHQTKDQIAVKVESPLISEGRLKINLRFAYATGKWEWACDWHDSDKHQTTLQHINPHQDIIRHTLDSTRTRYYMSVKWEEAASIKRKKIHSYDLTPQLGRDSTLSFSCLFTKTKPAADSIPDFQATKENSIKLWKKFWTSGGAIDLSGSTDPRAKELERRIILSQYLTKIQCDGLLPPQETGLIHDSWFGKFHLEMHLWHAAQFALWDRIGLLEKSLDWYKKIEDQARKRAQRQGFKGVRWPKMVGPSGRISPSSIGPFIIWQEPHIIYFAELCYRAHPNKRTLEKYKNLVFQTADFMASYAHLDKKKGEYVLGPDLMPAQEKFNPQKTVNPSFELAYWYWGLSTAQKWRQRLGMRRKAKWDSVLHNLSPLPEKNGVYLAAQSAPDSYTNPQYTRGHPDVLIGFSFLPKTKMISLPTMRHTFNKVLKVWNWSDTWGWDFPMMAMTAARLGEPKKAINALMMDAPKNTFLPDGNNYQQPLLRVYLPGNGSLLMATAMMAAGWDDAPDRHAPGFPDNGKWHIRWEGLKKMP